MKTLFLDKIIDIDLQLFDGGAAGAGGTGGPAGVAPEGGADAGAGSAAKGEKVKVLYGKQPGLEGAGSGTEEGKGNKPQVQVVQSEREALKAEFETLISTKFKDVFGERTQAIINDRFRQVKQLEGFQTQASPVMELLAQKYGVDAKDPEKLLQAIENDESYYEQEALEKGLSVQQLKDMKRLERENMSFREAEAQRMKQEQAQQIYAKWLNQASDAQKMFPGLDLKTECDNPETGERFLSILKAGVDVKTAYQIVHQDDILSGAMQLTAKTIEKKITDGIRAKGMRPDENGGGSSAPTVIVKDDPSKWTKQERAEIAERVRRGEVINL